VSGGEGPATNSASAPDGQTPGMREMPCLFCGVHEEVLRFRDGPFRVVECGRCHLVYVNPRLPPERLQEMYQDEYWTSERARDFGYSEYLEEAPLYLRTYKLRSNMVTKYKPQPGRVLDIGCAAGFFVSVMHEMGWDTTGIEISLPMVQYAEETLRLPDVRHGDMLSVDVKPKSYDVVTLWDVIEHLEDPRPHLTRAREALKDDGILVLETQNVASRFARMLGSRWQHYKHEEHLYHFDPESLARLLNDTGWEIVENTPRYGGKYVSMRFLVERVGRIHPWLTTLASPLRLLGNAALYLNMRDEMVVVARKR
jgi:2-polyprenyl-3-methyl-5-hydroxy-6-metoxy-1,4-benzoquinol methylase